LRTVVSGAHTFDIAIRGWHAPVWAHTIHNRYP
jgi:hypothetical protein